MQRKHRWAERETKRLRDQETDTQTHRGSPRAGSGSPRENHHWVWGRPSGLLGPILWLCFPESTLGLIQGPSLGALASLSRDGF